MGLGSVWYGVWFGMVRYGWVWLSSVQFVGYLALGALLFIVAAVAVVASGSDLALFALQSSSPLLLLPTSASCCLFLLRTMRICMFPIMALKSQPTVTASTNSIYYGTIEHDDDDPE